MKKDSFAILLVLSAIGFTVATSNLLLNPIISIYSTQFAGATLQEAGLIVSAFSITSLITRPLIGFYIGGKKMVFMPILGLFLMVVAPSGMVLLNTPVSMAFFRMIQGLGNAMIWAPALTLIVLSSSNTRRDRNISWYTTITSIGLALGPTIGTLSNSIVGMRNTFFLATGVALMGVPLSFILFQKRNSLLSSDYDAPNSNPKLSLSGLRGIFSDKAIAVAFTGYLAISYVYSILIAYGTIYARDILRINANLIPLLFVGFNIVVLFTRFSLGRLVKYLDKRQIIVSALFNTVCMITLLTFGNQQLFVLGFTLLGISHGLIYPTGAMLVAEATDQKKLNITNAFYMTMWDVGSFAGPTTSSLVVAFSIQTALVASIIVPLTIVGLNLTLWRENAQLRMARQQKKRGVHNDYDR